LRTTITNLSWDRVLFVVDDAPHPTAEPR